MSFLRTYKVEVSVFTLALALRILYLYLSAAHYGGDLVSAIHGADGYFNVSKNIIEGHGFTDSQSSPYVPYAFRPPLYFYFIALTYGLFNSYWGVIIFQMTIGSVLPLIGMKLASYVLESRNLIIAIGLFLALEPTSILYSTMFYSETVFILFLFLSLLYLFKYGREGHVHLLLISGGMLGLACLTRPTVEYLSIVISICLLWNARKRLSKKVYAHIVAYILVFMSVISPWIYRNYATFGVADLSPQLGVSLYTVLLPSVLSIENNTSWDQEYTMLISTGVKGPNAADITHGSEYARLAAPLLLEHKSALAITVINTAVSFFTSDGILDFLRHIGAATSLRLDKPAFLVLFSSPATLFDLIVKVSMTPTILVLFGRIFWISATLLCSFGAWRFLRREPENAYAVIIVAIILYFALTTLLTGFGVTARYRLPVNGLVLIFAAYAIAMLMPLWKKRLEKYA